MALGIQRSRGVAAAALDAVCPIDNLQQLKIVLAVIGVCILCAGNYDLVFNRKIAFVDYADVRKPVCRTGLP